MLSHSLPREISLVREIFLTRSSKDCVCEEEVDKLDLEIEGKKVGRCPNVKDIFLRIETSGIE